MDRWQHPASDSFAPLRVLSAPPAHARRVADAARVSIGLCVVAAAVAAHIAKRRGDSSRCAATRTGAA